MSLLFVGLPISHKAFQKLDSILPVQINQCAESCSHSLGFAYVDLPRRISVADEIIHSPVAREEIASGMAIPAA